MTNDAPTTIDDYDDETRYPGGKGTFYQKIINLMPPHETYIETHVGGGAVIKHKRAAKTANVALDRDAEVGKRFVNGRYVHIKFYSTDALRYLAGIRPKENILIFADPPYMMEARSKRRVYKYEYSDDDHRRLLSTLQSLYPCKIIISGYWTELYEKELAGWNHISFKVMTRGGKATEHLWYNYDPPTELHEYTYLGDTFRDRERIKKKQRRWIKNLNKMDILERQAMLDLITKEFL